MVRQKKPFNGKINKRKSNNNKMRQDASVCIIFDLICPVHYYTQNDHIDSDFCI